MVRVFSARLRRVLASVCHGSGLAAAWLALIVPGALLAVAPSPAASQALTSSGLQSTDPNQPMLLQADEMIYDNQNDRVTARGNVEIYYGTYTLLADRVIYDQRSNTLTAEGNVRIKEPDGAVINADRITLTDDFRDGFIASLKIVTQEDARIAAARAIREQGETTVFEKAAFTPCKPCEDKPEKPPTWQIKAAKVIHKKTEATITYKNASFELFGYPIAWFPYFKHADPSVKRKSGFLIPSISSSNELGTTVEVPYYFALAPNYDFTFSPVYTSKRGILWKGKWRHRTANGRYFVELAGIDQTESDAFAPGDEDLRGSIRTEGQFALNQYWEWGWDVTADSDDTFRRFYKLDNIFATDRISEVYLTGQRDRSYFSAKVYNFGGLLATDTAESEAWVHPVIDYNYIFADPILGGELSFDTNVVSLSRDDGATDSSRLLAQIKWRRTFIDGRGQVVTPFFYARGDYYHVSDFADPVTGVIGDDDIVRGVAAGGLEYRYPFVKHTTRGAHVMEPVAQIIARPGITNQDEIPNEDAQSLVYDDTLLFDLDKFSGYDRIESGTRANVGIRYTYQHYNGGYLRAVFGQSYQIAGSNEFEEGSGLASDASDYVAGLYLQPMQHFSIIAQGRFDEDTFDLRRTDLAANASYGPFSSGLIYANRRAQPALGIPDDNEEIQGTGAIELAENWRLFGDIRFDAERDERITDSVGIQYHDDCFALSVVYRETFIQDRDIEPDERVMLRFELKHLGAFDVDAGSL